jgi:hypothetical protein
MSDRSSIEQLAELAEGPLVGPEWERLRSERPELAAEVLVAQQVRTLIDELSSRGVAVPASFESEVMARVHGGTTLHAALSLSIPQFGDAVLELFAALFGLLPQPVEQSATGAGRA